MTRGNYQGWSYSPLDQINTGNVKNLTPVWSVSTGVDFGPRSAADRQQRRDVRRHSLQPGDGAGRRHRRVCCGATSASCRKASPRCTTPAAAWRCMATRCSCPCLDAVLVALDAKTGKVAWEAKVADWKDGYYMTMAPLVVKGKVLVGVAGGEFGVRGFVEAFDAETGKSAWKTYTIPAPGEPGSETWQKPDTWKTGGASTWMTGNYDPVANLVYWGTGNGSPWFGDQRPGDNLYTSSTVALDGDTGKIKGHFQYHQNESWDWDAMNAPMLVDFKSDGTAHARACSRHSATATSTGWGATPTAAFPTSSRKPTSRRTSSRASIRRPADRTSTSRTSRRPARPRSSAPACGAARTGRTRPTIRRRAWSTSRPTKTTATTSKARSSSAFPASGGPASRSPTSTSRSIRRRVSTANCRPMTSTAASAFGGICIRTR